MKEPTFWDSYLQALLDPVVAGPLILYSMAILLKWLHRKRRMTQTKRRRTEKFREIEDILHATSRDALDIHDRQVQDEDPRQ